MASVNKVIIVGNLGRDPEMRTFPSGDQVANVTIATTDRWRDKNTGENKESTEWHRVVFNGRLAEIVGQYLRKGSQVYVEGSLRTRKWTDQQSGQERYATEIRADTMQMLGSRPGGSGGHGGYDDGYSHSGGYGQGGNDRGGQSGGQSGGRDRGSHAGQGQQGQGGRQSNDRGGRSNDDQRQRSHDAGQYGGDRGHQQDRRPPQGAQQAQARDTPPQRSSSGFDDMDDDIPF